MGRTISILLFPFLALSAGAQNSNEDDQINLGNAITKRERTEIRNLEKKKAEVAGQVYKARENEFLFGRGNPTVLYSALQLFNSEIALSEKEDERLGCLERHWVRVKQIDEINRQRFEAGRIGIRDFLQSRYLRLDAEIKLAGIKENNRSELFPGWENQLRKDFPAKEFARARFELTRANPQKLSQEKLEGAWTRYERQEREFWAGRGSSYLLQEASIQVLETELSLADKKADRIGSLERHWLRTKYSEEVNRERLELGQINNEHFWMVQYFRVKAEIELIKAGNGKEFPAAHSSRPKSMAHTFFDETARVPNPFGAKQLAKLHFKNDLQGTHLTGLIQTKQDLVRKSFDVYEKHFLEGKGWLYGLQEASRDLLEVQLEQCDKDTDRISALQRYFNRHLRYEKINRGRYEFERIPIEDYQESVYYRLDAEIMLAMEKGKK